VKLREAIQHVFGVDAPALRDVQHIKWRALDFNPASWNQDESDCGHYVDYLGREDVIDVAIGFRYHATSVADLFHFFLDAVIAAVPFRHESFIVEVAPPHRLWYFADGTWRLAADEMFATETTISSDRTAFMRRLSRAAWLYYLFPTEATWITAQEIRDAWWRDGSPSHATILADWETSPRGCGDTLAALWGGYFTGGNTRTLATVLGAADAHASAAVRSSARLIRELDVGQRGGIHDEIRANVEQFWKT
jgi:hypothetical protein